MKDIGTPRVWQGQPCSCPAIALALLVLIPMAGCKQASTSQYGAVAKDEHPQRAATATSAEAPIPVQTLPQGPRFALQVAALNRRADAEALASRLSDQYGLQTLVAPVAAGRQTLYRVRLLMRDKNEAESLANSFFRTQNRKVWIVALP